MRCFVIGILVIRLSHRGSVVNGMPLFRSLRLLEEFHLGGWVSRIEAFHCDGKHLTMRYGMKFPLGCCSGRGKGESVEAVESEGTVRGAGT